MTNILIVVSRYFGGTLLGVSGLINAYKSAASDAISNAKVIERTLHDYYRLTFPYSSMNDVKKILKEENAGQSAQQFGLECSLVTDFRVLGREKVITRISRIEGINYSFIGTK
jgi:putative IMPACT (imprinted ancient) family translation regulator